MVVEQPIVDEEAVAAPSAHGLSLPPEDEQR
jgi:hypothetical protein